MRYRVKTGLNYRPDGSDPDAPEKRVEAGEIADDIPLSSLPWLLEDDLIEPVIAAGGFDSPALTRDDPSSDDDADEAAGTDPPAGDDA